MSDEEMPTGDKIKGQIGNVNGGGQAAIGKDILQIDTLVLQTYATSGKAKIVHVPPAAPHKLFGRKSDLDGVRTALGECRSVLLHGMGGMGKTALAAKAAQQYHSQNPLKDGVLWISEIGSAPVAAICDAIARSLGNEDILKLSPENKPSCTRDLLGNHDLLLVLDDVASAETANQFLSYCLPSGMPLLATSRRRYPAFSKRIEVRKLSPDAAKELFQERAGISELDGIVNDICELLEYYPLALVVAAGRVAAEDLPLHDLYEQLSDEKTRLGALDLEGDEDKNWSVRASLNVSYRGLNDDQRQVFTRLAVCFGDTVGLELLADVCGMERSRCERLIGQLVSRSLAEREGERLRLHQLVRDFGCDVLGEELQGVRNRVIEASAIYVNRYSLDTPEDHDRLEAELGTLLGALRHAMAREQQQATISLSEGLGRVGGVLDIRGHWTEGVAAGRLGMEAAEQAENDRPLATLRYNTATMLQRQGNYTEAKKLYSQNLDIPRQPENQEVIAASLHGLSSIAMEQGEYEDAMKLCKQSMEISRMIGDQEGLAISLGQFGNIAFQQGNYEEAAKRYGQSLDIKKNFKIPGSMAVSLHQWGVIAEHQGDYENATEFYELSLDINRKLGNQGSIGSDLNNLGEVARYQGNYEKARRYYQEALEIFERLQSPYAEMARQNLAALDQ